MKNILLIPVLALMLLATPALAQEDTLPEAGSTPASPFYFAERFFEGIGTFFTFGNSAKAERYLALAEERLAEAKVLAEDGDERAQVAVELYEERISKAKERAERVANNEGDPIPDIDLLARLNDATTKHLTVLDEVLDRVPEQARASVEAARERSITGQIEALRVLAPHDAERAVEIFDRAAEGRLNRAGGYIKIGDIKGESVERMEDALEEFEQYADFGNEIAGLAEGLQSGETTVEELVERAASRHLEILQSIQSKVPVEAQESIQRAIDNAGRAQDSRATVPTGTQPEQQQGAPENTGAGNAPVNTSQLIPPQAGQDNDERDDNDTEIETETEDGNESKSNEVSEDAQAPVDTTDDRDGRL